MKPIIIQDGWSIEKAGQERVSAEDIAKLLLQEEVPSGYIYAVLDYAVAFGWYENGKFQLIFPNKKNRKLPSANELEWAYLQELRIFETSFEFRAARREDDTFSWRLRQDYATQKEAEPQDVFPCSFMEETCKLWGAMQEKISNEWLGTLEWNLLSSARGTKFFVPVKYREGLTVGLKVRNYVEFHVADDLLADRSETEKERLLQDSSVIRFVDNRLVGFVSWAETENGGKKNGGE